MEFDFQSIEKKWREHWEKSGTYKVQNDTSRPKFYVLDMFPYPSGAGLHVGHPLGYVASDIVARYKRLSGFNVLHPMGYDAFGLPAEQYAIETGTHPSITTAKAIETFRAQMDKIGFSYDWSREVKTSDPAYYKWTQWIFLKLFGSWYNKETNKAEPISTLVKKFESGDLKAATSWTAISEVQREQLLMNYRLAYQSFAEVNWCPALGTVLANDEVKDGKSERGGHPVERKKMRQWFLRITEYADRLLDGLEHLDWSEAMKEMQKNWIGKSAGASLKFAIANTQKHLEVFTTRPDTIFGATFMVIAPEHELVKELTTDAQRAEVQQYLTYVKSRTDVERQQEKRVTGVFTGSHVLHPFTGNEVPIWIAEYVLSGYGTGAIMAVPSDDERDKKFAEKFGLPIVEVIDKSKYPNAGIGDKLGTLINSDFLNGLDVPHAILKAVEQIEERGIGTMKVNYRLRDAGFSRQRYWGEPFPIRYKQVGEPDMPFGESNDIAVPLDASDLPLHLPDVPSFKPTGDGRSPLANSEDWVRQRYETDTMPGYAGSSWYFLRYMDAGNENEFASKEALDYWQQVDIYFGGAEHAVGHLLYARMWHKFLHDLGYVKTDEPFKKLVNQGMIQGRSSFVYRVNYEVDLQDWPSEDLALQIVSDKLNSFYEFQPHIFITKELYDEYIESENVPYSVVEEVNRVVKSSAASLAIVLEPRIQDIAVSGLHVDISFVENDQLDIVKFKEWKSDSWNSYFVLNVLGHYVCGSAPEKMSKSKYNVINPDDVIAKYGADCFRMFEMFLGPLEQSKPWDDKGINGVSNFLRKFWRLFFDDATWKVTDDAPTDAELKVLHKTLKKLKDDIERMNFNTCISGFMIAVNELTALGCSKRKVLEPLLIGMAPFAPFLTEELWGKLGNSGSIHHAKWPEAEAKYLVEDNFEYPISINGKTRLNISFANSLTAEEIQAQVLANDKVLQYMEGKQLKKFVFVKGRIVNVVV